MAKPDGVPILIRRTHEERVLAVLRDSGPLARSDIETRVGLSRTTVSEITGSLLRRGALVEVTPEEGSRGRGRPAARLALDPTSGQFLGIDFGHRRVYEVVVNASNEVIGSGARQYAEDAAWPVRLATAFELLGSIERDSGIRFGALEGIGIGVSGPTGMAALSRPAAWAGAVDHAVIDRIRAEFGQRFDAPVLIDNNTRFAGLAEAVWGRHADIDSLLYVRLADGVGGGLVVGGRLVSGAFGMAGEIGHVSVPRSAIRCWCGKTGCLETVASVPAIIAAAQGIEPAIESLADVASHLEDDAVRDVVVGAARALAAVLATVSMVVDPRQVVVAGDVLMLGPAFIDTVLDEFERQTVPAAKARTRLRSASMQDDAGALGAIAAAFHRSPLLAGFAGLDATASAPATGEGYQKGVS